MEVLSHRFADNVRRALADPRLQAAYGKATERFQTGRAAAFAAFPEGEALRDLARRIKARTVAELDRYLGQLADAVAARGGEVHWAADAAAPAQTSGSPASPSSNDSRWTRTSTTG